MVLYSIITLYYPLFQFRITVLHLGPLTDITLLAHGIIFQTNVLKMDHLSKLEQLLFYLLSRKERDCTGLKGILLIILV